MWGRRRFLHLGGAAILSPLVLSACSGSVAVRPGAAAPASTTSTSTVPTEVGALRLASSLEHYLVGLYQTAAGSGLLITPAIAEMAQWFAGQHSDHAGFDESATARAGGQPFTTANAAVAETLKPRFDALRTEGDVLKLAYDVESALAATYLSSLGTYANAGLNARVASVLAVEARHVAVLGMVLSGLAAPSPSVSPRGDSPPFPSGGFLTGDGAIPPGTGV